MTDTQTPTAAVANVLSEATTPHETELLQRLRFAGDNAYVKAVAKYLIERDRQNDTVSPAELTEDHGS